MFNKLISDSETIAYFEKNNCLDLTRDKFQIIIYDNSAQSQEVPLRYASIISYFHDRSNGGVASAYNYALSLTQSADDWLVLLDQDSDLPERFIDEIWNLTTLYNIDIAVAAIAPHVVCETTIVSPCKVHVGGMLRPVDLNFKGEHSSEIRAINSGMAVRASFMKQIGGFNKAFWLDYLDHWLCRTIYATGKKIYVSKSVINHDLSVINYNRVSEQRAANILQAEMFFYGKYMPWFEQVLYVFRLLCRSLKQLVTIDNKQIALNTMRAGPKFLFNDINVPK
jgi:GT2 family glycosyltransferase